MRSTATHDPGGEPASNPLLPEFENHATSPYAPPEADGDDAPLCPRCGHPMELGDLTSGGRIRWRPLDQSTLEFLVKGGRSLGDSRPGFGFRLRAAHCVECNLIRFLG